MTYPDTPGATPPPPGHGRGPDQPHGSHAQGHNPPQGWAPPPPPKSKKKGCLIAALIGLVALILFGSCAAMLAGGSQDETPAAGPAPKQSAPTDTPETTTSADPAAPAKPDVPAEHQAALRKAEDYAQTMQMSKKGVYNQLTSEIEGFSKESAKYATDNVEADWKANALAKAKTYQNDMNMSPKAIRTQLTSEFEGFTPAEADYAVKNL